MVASNAHAEESAEFHTIDPEDAKTLRKALLDQSELNQLERKLKILGNRTRLNILSFLGERDLCVHDLSALLEMSQSAVSHQLKQLYTEGVLERTKDGRVVYYSLANEEIDSILTNLNTFLKSS